MMADEEIIGNQQYSEEFKKILSNPELLQKYLQESHVSFDLKRWKQGRKFIADVIDRDGPVLDIGCANGFLLRCLQEWTGRGNKLIPYGIDTNPEHIKQAKELFPQNQGNFFEGSVEGLVRQDSPIKFPTVYWNVWDNYDFSERERIDVLKGVIDKVLAPEGRLILGFYDVKEGNNKKRIQQLEQLVFKLTGHLKAEDSNEELVWLDKVENV